MAMRIDKVRVVAGRIIRVINTARKYRAESSFYHSVWVEDADGGNERCLMITASEMKRIEKRSQKNREDWPEKGMLTDLFD